MFKQEKVVAVLGMGYVGLPLAVELGLKYRTIGFDVDAQRIVELKANVDETGELTEAKLREASKLEFTSDVEDIAVANIYIVAVGTPVTSDNQPDLSIVQNATMTLAPYLRVGDVVIYESTVFPGATETVFVPILEQVSGLKYNQEFFCGYSPERVNPGDTKNAITDVVKLTAGSTPQCAELVDELYKSIITAGTHSCSSIAIAEASKLLENTQRDVNVGLINEFAKIADALDLNIYEIIAAAKTKWNFHHFVPGLVGGHCISVDPYYLISCARAQGIEPELVATTRKINEGMANYWGSRMIDRLREQFGDQDGLKVLIMGVTFKENCADARNSKVFDIANLLEDKGYKVSMYDPKANKNFVYETYGRLLLEEPDFGEYQGVMLAVAHEEFAKSISEGSVNFADHAVVMSLKSLQL